MIFTAIDLELNKDEANTKTTQIIQLGSCTGNIHTGEILETLSLYVKIDKPLIPFITQLTGITDNDLSTKGTTLLEAYNKLKEVHSKYKAHISLVTWGSGDAKELKEQLLFQGMKEEEWIHGWRSIDVKTVVQSIMLARGQSLQGGLAKSMTKFGLKFDGTKHNAESDSINTFKIYHELLKRLKNV